LRFGGVVGCSLSSGLFARSLTALALMVSADEVPFCFASYDALDIPRVVLIPGLTGSRSLHMVLATPEARLAAALIGGFCCYAAARSGAR
jgi:hypothetical protein